MQYRTENHRLQREDGRAEQNAKANEIARRVSGLKRATGNRASGSLDLASRVSGTSIGPVYVHDLFPAKRGR